MDPALKAHLEKLAALPAFRPLRAVLTRSPGPPAKPADGPPAPGERPAEPPRPRSLDPGHIRLSLAGALPAESL